MTTDLVSDRATGLRFAVLGSTRGTAFEPVVSAWRDGTLGCEPAVVLSNRRHPGIREKALQAEIPFEHLPKGELDRESYDHLLHQRMEAHQVDFILLIGWMRILSTAFVRQWWERIVNVHPSLLPRHAGRMDLEVHRAVLAAGDRETGCTLHLVDEGVDSGPILIQKRCPVKPDDDPESLKEKVQALEGEAFIELLKTPKLYLKAL